MIIVCVVANTALGPCWYVYALRVIDKVTILPRLR